MGVGSFGVNTAFIASNAMRKGYGGYGVYDENENNKPEKKFNWIWFTINLFLFSVSLYTLICFNCDFSHYTRVGDLIKKNQSAYKVKQNFYPDYYFTVKWSDRAKEKETFEVGAKTFFSCEEGERVYFNRFKPEYEWVKSGWGFACFALCGIIWIFSGLATLLKDL